MSLTELLLPAVTLLAIAVFYARSPWRKNVLAAKAAAALDPTDLQDGQIGRITGTVEADAPLEAPSPASPS